MRSIPGSEGSWAEAQTHAISALSSGEKVFYLDHEISWKGIATDPAKSPRMFRNSWASIVILFELCEDFQAIAPTNGELQTLCNWSGLWNDRKHLLSYAVSCALHEFWFFPISISLLFWTQMPATRV